MPPAIGKRMHLVGRKTDSMKPPADRFACCWIKNICVSALLRLT